MKAITQAIKSRPNLYNQRKLKAYIMTDFILIDLESQYLAVTKHIQGQTKQQILEWLQQFGDVQQLDHPYDMHVYGFASPSGRRNAFRLTDDGHLILIGQHSMQSSKIL